ncbi:hypothetical protein EII22_01450 [Coriobacteriales bacterium OH1046]|nr:hypothetical protein EII22_01450 [Coriobacteriales bacterium OH1046]
MRKQTTKNLALPRLPIRRDWLLRSLGCAAVQVLLVVFMSSGGMTTLLFIVAGSVFVPQAHPSFLSMLMSLLPLASWCLAMAGCLGEVLHEEGPLVAYRCTSKESWLLFRLLHLALLSIAFVWMGNLSSSAVLAVLSDAVHLGVAFMVSLWSSLVEGLLVAVLALLINLLALKAGEVGAFSIVFGAHAATLAALGNAPIELAATLSMFLPSTQGILAWHACQGLSETLAGFAGGPTLWWSFLYLAVVLAVILAFSARALRTVEIL